ncbi:MAG: diacylglycerol kinase family protein [Candidatus Omnitrophica bacterium]|nr:diacylglycerol kinase family protein [Candidatus Omnitrophota bacterium]
MKRDGSFLQERWRSIGYALAGLRDILKTEHNAWVHAFCTVAVLGLAFYLGLDEVRFLIIVIFIALVWMAEAFNTVLELVIDIVSPEYCETARRAKDIAATAVLFAAAGALIAGVVILGPPLLARLGLAAG